MKRLVLPLIASLALPTAVSAGDLGSADLPMIEEAYSLSEKDQKKMIAAKNNEFNFRCHGGKNFVKRNMFKCKVEFKDGRLTVDNSFDILPSQVITITQQEWFAQWTIDVTYMNRKDRYSIATFYVPNIGGVGLPEAKIYPFLARLI